MRGVRSIVSRTTRANISLQNKRNAGGDAWRVLGAAIGGGTLLPVTSGVLPLAQTVRRLSGVAARSSRKKKKKVDSKDQEGPTPKVYNFVAEAENMLDIVHKALLPFQAPANEGFVMNTKYKDGDKTRLEEVELICGKEGGAFQFKIDARNEVMNAATPVSGALQYYFDGDKWLNVHDHHDVRGIIVRDMLRLTSSAPKL